MPGSLRPLAISFRASIILLNHRARASEGEKWTTSIMHLPTAVFNNEIFTKQPKKFFRLESHPIPSTGAASVDVGSAQVDAECMIGITHWLRPHLKCSFHKSNSCNHFFLKKLLHQNKEKAKLLRVGGYTNKKNHIYFLGFVWSCIIVFSRRWIVGYASTKVVRDVQKKRRLCFDLCFPFLIDIIILFDCNSSNLPWILHLSFL